MSKLTRFEMRVDDGFIEKVDDWRRVQPRIPSRAEALRLLAEKGMSEDVLQQNGIEVLRKTVKKLISDPATQKADKATVDALQTVEKFLAEFAVAIEQSLTKPD